MASCFFQADRKPLLTLHHCINITYSKYLVSKHCKFQIPKNTFENGSLLRVLYDNKLLFLLVFCCIYIYDVTIYVLCSLLCACWELCVSWTNFCFNWYIYASSLVLLEYSVGMRELHHWLFIAEFWFSTMSSAVHELPQSHCGHNWEGTLFSW